MTPGPLVAFLNEYTPALLMATVMLSAVVGMVAHDAFSKHMMAEHGEDVPKWTFGGNRTEAWAVTIKMLFSREPGAPAHFKILLFLYRILWIALLLELAFMAAEYLRVPL